MKRVHFVVLLPCLAIACSRSPLDTSTHPIDCDALPATPVVTHSGPRLDLCGGVFAVPNPLPQAMPDVRALSAAMTLTSGMVPQKLDYDRVFADVAAIKETGGPGSVHIPYTLNKLTLLVDAETALSAQSGEYHAWDCLNAHYQVVSFKVATSFMPMITLTFAGPLATEAVAQDYAQLPGVTRADAGIGHIDGSGFCVVRDGEFMHYVVTFGYDDCEMGCLRSEYRYFRTAGPGDIDTRAEWEPSNGDWSDKPCWLSICNPLSPYGN